MGTGKGTGKSMRKLCRNYPLAIYPLVSPLLQTDKKGICLLISSFIANPDTDERACVNQVFLAAVDSRSTDADLFLIIFAMNSEKR